MQLASAAQTATVVWTDQRRGGKKYKKEKKTLVFELKRINDHRLWVEEFIVYRLATG